MTIKNNKVRIILNSKRITSGSVFLFLMVILVIYCGNRYMSVCIQNEQQTQKNRTELCALGEQLADASDYLTDEARKFAVTGDTEYLYNYWHEINATKTRDSVIDELSSYDLLAEEKALLSQAKLYSDTLIETETKSMKLVMLANAISPNDYTETEELYGYMKYVQDCEISQKYYNMTPEELKASAVQMLYDSFYNDSKASIMSPIGEFQSAINNRLAKDVEKASQGIHTALCVQIVCFFVVALLIGLLFAILDLLYIKPLKEYYTSISEVDMSENSVGVDFTRVRVNPKGAYELYRFGKMFNGLSLFLGGEFKKRETAEEEMRKARDEADSANNAKTVFFAHMSHELRTPLNAIMGYLYLLKDTGLDDKQRHYCGSIEVASENLLGLINNVLDFSKIESGNMLFENADFNLHELMNDVYNMMENGISEKNILFKTDIGDDLPEYVKGDSLRLKQVLINLLGNALKFTEKGSITLSAKQVESSEKGYVVKFSVSDTGIGISSEDRKKIFKAFVQSDAGVTRKFGGTGLGLAISGMIVENASKGKYNINVESEVGKGSCFYFNMYFEKGSENAIVNNSENNFARIEESATILLVDDNEVNLVVEKEILKKYNLKVIIAKNGFEALEKAKQTKVDMVLLDLNMPDMDGYETAKRLRLISNYRFVPIIALTADIMNGAEEKIKNSDINDCLSKPFKPQSLCDIIKKYLNIAKEVPKALLTDSNILFDFDECLENLNGDKAVLIKMIKRFVTGQAHSGEYIKTHIEHGDFMNARWILHDVLGLSGNLSCKRLYNISKKLREELIQNSNNSVNEFYDVWNDTISVLKTYIEENEAETDNGKNEESFEKIWQEFISLCENFELSAEDCFEKNKRIFKMNLSKADYAKTEEYVKKYDFMGIISYFGRNGNV